MANEETKRQKKILIAEDEAVIRFDLSEHLTAEGFEVLEAAHSTEAFDLLEKVSDIDVLITDIDMPGIVDGLILAKFVAERWPHIQVLVMSGKRRAEAGDLPDGSIFMLKPYDLSAISEAFKSGE